MYNLVEKIGEVNYYIVSNKYLLYKQNNDIIYQNKVLEKDVRDDVILTENNIFYNKDSGFYCKNLIENDKMFFDNYRILNINPMFNESGVIIDNDNSIYLYSKISFNKNKIDISNYDWGSIYLDSDYIFIGQNNTILTYHIPTASLFWQFPLSQFGTFKTFHGNEENYNVKRFIGVWENELLVACSNSLILAIDIETGDLLHQWQSFKKPENIKACRDEKLPEASDFRLDVKNNKLIASAYYSYLEIDLNTKEIKVTDLKDQLEEHDIFSFNLALEKPFSDTHMFSTVIVIKKTSNILKNGLVAINRQTKKIDWFYTDEMFGTGTNSPKLVEDKLYQLTLDGKLYIFEKE